MKREKEIYKGITRIQWIMMIVMVIFLIAGIWFWRITPHGALIIIGVVLFFGCITFANVMELKSMIADELECVGYEQSQIQKNLLKELPVPYVLTSVKGEILWRNQAFDEIADSKSKKKNISQIFETMRKGSFPGPGEKSEYDLVVKDRNYHVECSAVAFDELIHDGVKEVMLSFYFYDQTDLAYYRAESESKSLIAGLIYIDNYEEVLDSMEEVRQSLLFAVVERKIYKYMHNFSAIVKKFERDKFLFVFEAKYFDEMLEKKFALMEDVRGTSMGNSLSVTLSIGIGINAPDYAQAYDSARAAVDLALGRGGDQIVIKDGETLSYYGGNTQKVEKSTRVKARVKAHALRELMQTKGKVFIMGHRMPDADCVGAALGIYRIAKTYQKETYIVMDQNCPAITPIVEGVKKASEDSEPVFVTNDQALSLRDANSMMVIVDVNIPNMTECPSLLKLIQTVVVLDHHRQTKENIKNAVLSYVEPYASSSCEMVAEILQYIAEKPKLLPIEADALYAGVLIDTDNFVVKAGVRTFEAAAYLRRAGCDVTRVRKMFRDDIAHSKLRAQIINDAEIYLGEFALATFSPKEMEGATVIGAKAANELLDIQGIRGSFVLTNMPGYIYISARSIDDLNVHMIMERMGGGGHLTMAATQIKNKSIYEVEQDLKILIKTMKDNGEI